MEIQEELKTDNNNHVDSVIDIRGIQFDISSVLKDVTNSIKNNLKTSFDDAFKESTKRKQQESKSFSILSDFGI